MSDSARRIMDDINRNSIERPFTNKGLVYCAHCEMPIPANEVTEEWDDNTFRFVLAHSEDEHISHRI